MNIESPFFSTEGLTSTSANYIANNAKNFYEALEEKLRNLQFYQTTLKIIGNENIEIIDYGTNKEDFDNIEQIVKDIACAKSLISWLREAIKQKDSFVNKLEEISIVEYFKEQGVELPSMPIRENTITEKEYLNSLSVKERQEYYTIQTYASTIGQLVHKDGYLYKARKELREKLQSPIETETNGRDTLIYKFISTYTPEQIDELFFKLQAKQREYQAEFNNMKHRMEQFIESDRISKHTKFMKELDEYNIKMKEYQSIYEDWISKQRKEIQALKIVIPNNLKTIYEKINCLGK